MRSDVPDEDFSCTDPYTEVDRFESAREELRIEPGKCFAHLECSPTSSYRVIDLRYRCSEKSHHRIADILIECPSLSREDICHT